MKVTVIITSPYTRLHSIHDTPKTALNARPDSTAIVTPDPVTTHRPGALVGAGVGAPQHTCLLSSFQQYTVCPASSPNTSE